jgi:hypothetical protein
MLEEKHFKRIERYVQDGGGHCPFCGGRDLVHGDASPAKDGSIGPEQFCQSCGRAWHDVFAVSDGRYALVGVADAGTVRKDAAEG